MVKGPPPGFPTAIIFTKLLETDGSVNMNQKQGVHALFGYKPLIFFTTESHISDAAMNKCVSDQLNNLLQLT